MPLRTRLFLIITAIVLLILVISIILVVRSRRAQNNQQSQTAETQTTAKTTGAKQQIFDSSGNVVTSRVTVKKPTSEAEEKNSARQAAKIFTERYGSYSTDNNYQNIKDVQKLSTAAMWSKLSAQMTGQTAASFVGVTTEAISATISNWSVAAAKITVGARRTQEKDSKTSTKYQQADVELVKESSGWLVDKFSWE